MNRSNRFAIAARVRSLLAGDNHADLHSTARVLGVDELALRMTAHERSPQPDLHVLAAVVIAYGIDPTWLVTGDYDPATHRQVLEGDGATVATAVQRLFEMQTEKAPVSDVGEQLST